MGSCLMPHCERLRIMFVRVVCYEWTYFHTVILEKVAGLLGDKDNPKPPSW